jgi:hypothetical protein
VTRRNGKTYNIVLGGIIAAISVVFMLLTMLIPIGEFIFPALAGILLISTVFEMGEKWSYLIYAVVGILSIMLLPDKSPAVYYILFLGHYTITKSYIERINNKPLKLILKFIIFNICGIVSFLIIKFIFKIDTISTLNWYIIYAVILNITFFIYDISLDKMIALYKFKWRKYIHGNK